MTLADAVALARDEALLDLAAETFPRMTVHRDVQGTEHRVPGPCWCLPLVISILDPRLEELTARFDMGQ